MHYHVGWNLTGYLPEIDPFIIGDIGSALEYLRDETREVADSLAMVVDSLDDEDADAASVEELRDAESLSNELDAILGNTEDGVSDIDSYAQWGWDGTIRYVHYWIMPCPIDRCETDYCEDCNRETEAYWLKAYGFALCAECESDREREGKARQGVY